MKEYMHPIHLPEILVKVIVLESSGFWGGTRLITVVLGGLDISGTPREE